MILDLTREYQHGPSDRIPYKLIHFPDGHKHIDLSEAVPKIKSFNNLKIITRIRNFDDMFILLQTIDAVRLLNSNAKITLYCTYLLAGRYDRRMYPGDSFDLKIICKLINDMNFEKVTLVEPHSNVSATLLDRVEVKAPLDKAVANMIKNGDVDEKFVIFAPDLGAVKRVENLIKEKQINAEVGYLHKTRNLLTGEITGMKIMSSPELDGKTVILFDDLCDGGRTFTEAAKLLTATCPWIVLAVTHGLFSKGYEALLDNGIDHIITTDSYQEQKEHPRVEVVRC